MALWGRGSTDGDAAGPRPTRAQRRELRAREAAEAEHAARVARARRRLAQAGSLEIVEPRRAPDDHGFAADPGPARRSAIVEH